ncbi:MAG TPA: sigma-70 family RNA polymerase sigma factor [Deltaproteobacteria bacterium]|nr:sigma-70 family RNA polymerase sigma factor [Deltaproteobacteria bacterium]
MEGQNMEERYLEAISKYPILSPEEERELALRYKAGDEEAGKRLVTANLRFVVKVALEYRGYGVKLQDLIQEGNLGLIVALRHFDPSRGYRFISYAIWWIRAYIQNYIMRSWSLVKVGTTQAQKKLFYKMGRLRELEEGEGTREERLRALAEELKVGVEDVEEMYERIRSRDLSLDARVDEEQETTFLDFLADFAPNQEEKLADKERRQLIKRVVEDALSRLSDRERTVIEKRLMAEEPMTLQELGQTFNVSRERVRQIELQAMKKLKKSLEERRTLLSSE